MRYVYMTMMMLIVVLIVIFTVQNLQTVTIVFLSSSMTIPLSVLVFLVYLLGMLTGGVVMAFVRLLMRKAQAKPVRKQDGKEAKDEASTDG
jgi:uncharacterized integral membrane protein